MKTVYQALVDYEMALLQAIAARRAISLITPSQQAAVDILAESLLSPAETAIMLDDLSEPEQEALQLLLANGGWVDEPRFARDYGAIRPMGQARLERERPWENPASVAEGLWYRGLIFKTIRITPQGSSEIVYLPDDLLALLKQAGLDVEVPANPTADFDVAGAPEPEIVRSGSGHLQENVFNLLVYLQINPVRLQQGSLIKKDREGLMAALLPPPVPGLTLAAELDFLLHLAQRANLLVQARGRLRPHRDSARTWLQSSPRQQTRVLQNTWRADPTWNDLWHVPGLVPQPTGWENSPLLARSKILAYLSQLTASPGTWYGLADFVAAIKRVDPDFQRPHGDYQSWYLQDAAGNSLMGFENWDKVEGALIRYVLAHLLPVLGVVEVGLPAETASPTSFKITEQGADFLAEREPPPVDAPKPRYFQVNPNFSVQIFPGNSLYDRFQLARFAALERREADRVVYRITQSSVGRALRNGVTADQMVAFLARVTNNRTPLKVVETMRTWERRQGAARMEQITLLRVQNPAIIEEFRNNSALCPLLGESVGPQAIVIPQKNIAEVRRILIELGYLQS